MLRKSRLVIICVLVVSIAMGGAPALAAAPADAVVNSGAADLFWGTYIGGSSVDRVGRMAVGDDGAIYVAGLTMSADLPATVGSYDTSYNGGFDVYVAKLSADGKTLEYLTYLGGSAQDDVSGIAVDDSGVVYLCGTTQSSDFPTTLSCYDDSYNGSGDVFVAKIAADGASLAYGSFLGGTSTDNAYGMALDGDGAVYLTGSTESTDFPAASGPGYDVSHNDVTDAFVVKMAADGASLTYATFLGGDSMDIGSAICVDDLGAAYVVGNTASSGFPTTVGAYDTTANGGPDGFVTKVMTDGLSLSYSTFLGGTGQDAATAVAVDSAGSAFVAGYTESSDFPTTADVYGATFGGNRDAFVIKMSPNGSTLIKSTYLGGTGQDQASGMSIDTSGGVYLIGDVNSGDMPLGSAPGFDTSRDADWSGWMIVLGNLFDELEYATYLEGGALTTSSCAAIARDADGDVYVAGYSGAADFGPIARGYDSSPNGSYDGYVAKLSLEGEGGGDTGTRLVFPLIYQGH